MLLSAPPLASAVGEALSNPMPQFADPDASPRAKPANPALGYGLALTLTALAIGLAVLLDRDADVANLSLIFVLPVVIVAANFSLGAALTAAVAGAVGANFFLIAPRYTFSVEDSADLWGLFLLLAVAVIVSAVAGEARRRTLEARAHAAQAAALHGLARGLVGAGDPAAIVASATHALSAVFKAPAVVLLADEAGLLQDHALAEADLQAARWSLSSRLPLRAGAGPSQGAVYDFWPVTTPSRRQAVIGVRLDAADGRPQGADRLAEIVGGYLAVALERDRFAAQAARAALAHESDRVKADLLAAVSHDLRTPLSTILVALQSLRKFGDGHDAATREELLSLAESETARLAGLVGNLLDMGRIDADAVAVQIAPTPLYDLIAAALDRASAALQDLIVENSVDAAAPAVLADPGLAVTAIGALLDNAGKYAPAGSTVRIQTRVDGANAVIVVTDEGPGLPTPHNHLFDRFERGVGGDGRPPGTGLGLSIARGFLVAQGGSVQAANRTDCTGAELTARLPLAPA